MSILIGRTIDILKCCSLVLPLSKADFRFSFPVSFCIRMVLRCSRTGAYVSRVNVRVKINTAPPYSNIEISQTHHNPMMSNLPRWRLARKSTASLSLRQDKSQLTACQLHAIRMRNMCLLRGPNVGPRRGPRKRRPVTAPLFSKGTKSATVPNPRVNGQQAAIPTKRRKTMRAAKLFASAQAMLKMRKMKLQIL